jgi:hypothetical protein
MKTIIYSFPKILIGLLNKEKKNQERLVGIAPRLRAGPLRSHGSISGRGN